jgi:hypothetical protein
MADLARQAPNTFTAGGTKVKQGFINDDTDIKYLLAQLTKQRRLFSGDTLTSPNEKDYRVDESRTPNWLQQYTSGAWADVMPLETPTSGGSGMRQCILTGPVDVSGNPALAEAGTGLAVNLLGPIVANFAAGYDGADPVDYREVIESETGAWTGLPATQTVYLYIDRNPSTGAITYGWTIVEPVYQRHEPTPASGLHWFNGDKMQSHDGVEWTDRQRVFPLYCTTDTDSVTDVFPYPYSDWWRNIDIDASGFAGNLATADNTVQKVAAKLDAMAASAAEAIAGTETKKFVSPATLRSGLNAAGDAPIYACRAWVNFNGTGTPAIYASGNVTSITDNGTGHYTVNFTTAMEDANYCVVCNQEYRSANQNSFGVYISAPPETTRVHLYCASSGTAADTSYGYVAIFR